MLTYGFVSLLKIHLASVFFLNTSTEVLEFNLSLVIQIYLGDLGKIKQTKSLFSETLEHVFRAEQLAHSKQSINTSQFLSHYHYPHSCHH